MDDPTRRGFLITAGVAAAATAGVAATIAARHDSPADETAASAAAALPATSGALVAYVADVRSGRVSLFVGESEVVVNDPELVATLARHAARKQV